MSTIDVPALRALYAKVSRGTALTAQEICDYDDMVHSALPALLDAYEERERLKRPMTTMRERIAKAILNDLTDRRGIRQAFDGLDQIIMEEIKYSISSAVLAELENPAPEMIDEAKRAFLRGNGTPSELMGIAFTAAIKAAKHG